MPYHTVRDTRGFVCRDDVVVGHHLFANRFCCTGDAILPRPKKEQRKPKGKEKLKRKEN